ncbi:MAG: hypothetical protein KJO27_07090 [Gammaproteobacteria bacterium]|nr:hypothetical protein [Gammaproteobacteria bacterium]NND46381.1 carboxypeptidase regulatory-like domain-containing protein [Woeseiaceae bacterium]NNL45174.1 carboxypeptidase regulatory-like domain-containing protein [Woeseiaceae bacterium]
MVSGFNQKNIIFAVSLLALAACGGGSGSTGSGGTTNRAPIANAGTDQTVAEQSRVALDGTASRDPDGDNLTYSWTQTAGTDVSIANSSSPTASFDAPAAGETLTFQLAVNDGTTTDIDTVDFAIVVALPAVTVSGKVFYEFVPPNPLCRGLNFNATETRPIRAATVQLLDAGSNVLATTVAAANGDYVFANIPANLSVRLRVRAELKRTGSPSWDVDVRDNVDTSPNPPALGSRPLYVVDSAVFNTGGADVSRDLTATTGWGGSSYTGPRAAAPFAILDAIYSGMLLVLTADPGANFGPMDAFWSVNNTLTSPTDIDAGELSTSFYRSDLDALFLLGDAGTDTEEFDDHVSVHEWGHYFEDVFSRSDSIGGSHSGAQSLDARLAFGEGWATALAAMALDDPQYCDTGAAGSSSGFGLDTENYNSGRQGWFNEMSVATLLYDLWDTDVDADLGGTDADSIGFGPIFETMAGPQRTTPAFTTLFSFATELRSRLNDPADQAFLDSQLARENIETMDLDIWGSDQDNIQAAPNQARDVLPLYTTLPTNGAAIEVCTNSDYDFQRDGNKLAEYRYLRMDVTQAGSYDIVVDTVSADGAAPSQPDPGFDCVAAFENDPDDPIVHTYSDPDFELVSSGTQISAGLSCTPNTETATTPILDPGTYVVALTEFRFADEDTIAGYADRVCLDVSATPN